MSCKILVVKLGAIGDVLAATPAFKALRKKYPDAHISLLVGEWSKNVVENNPVFNELIVVNENIFWKKKIFSLGKLFYKLYKRKYDMVYVLHWSKLFNIFVYFLGIPERIGFNREGDGVLLTKKFDFQEEVKGLHRIDRYLQMVTDNYIKEDRNMHIYLSDSEVAGSKKNFMDEAGSVSDIVGIAPGGGYNPKRKMDTKRWPVEYYVELTNKIHSELNMPVMLFGGESDIEPGMFIESKTRNKKLLLNYINKTSLRTTYAFMSFCRLVIANDSAPVYLAASAGIPTISIYGPTVPYDKAPIGKIHRYLYKELSCSPCYKYGYFPKCDTLECLRGIKPEDVFGLVKDMLNKTNM